ncbi:MAG: NADH-quinone oxidoreductase subunit NuoN [Steroidobacteraceae bacterium]|nr:NADH-quinone oxidoreductase subunit NuoN [Steroidobacteraceae bacterium]
MPDTPTFWSTIAAAAPEAWLVAAMCAVLMIEVFAGGTKRPRLTGTMTLLALAFGAWLTLEYGSVSVRIEAFHGLYVADPLALVLKLGGLLFTAVSLLYSRPYLDRRGIGGGEYYVLALTALLGIHVLASAGNLLSLYIGVELLGLSLYAMVAFDRESGVAAEAAMKYFVLGSIASGMLLYGISLVYGLTGTLALGELAQHLAAEPGLGLIVGAGFIVAAIAFKFGAVPFHMWVPDVYHGAPTPVTLFVSTAPKFAYFALIYRLLAQGLDGLSPTWTQMIAAVAVLSLFVGNVYAIAQTNLKRMLAYSAIANVGFILLGFTTGTVAGYRAALYYMIVYVLMALGSFGVILLASRRGFEADELEDYKGLHARDPLLALSMMMLMFSTAGVPPFVGFWAKLAIFDALWQVGSVWLVVIAALAAIVGAFYYIRIVKLMYFDDAPAQPRGEAGVALRFVLALNAFAALALGLVPAALIDVCIRALG